MAAESTLGACASATARSNASLVPSALPDASASAVSFTVSVPVALAAASAPSNVITCVSVALPERAATVRAAPPPVDSARPAYADAPAAAATGSL